MEQRLIAKEVDSTVHYKIVPLDSHYKAKTLLVEDDEVLESVLNELERNDFSTIKEAENWLDSWL